MNTSAHGTWHSQRSRHPRESMYTDLAREHREPTQIGVNKGTQEEQDYGIDKEVTFLLEDELEDQTNQANEDSL